MVGLAVAGPYVWHQPQVQQYYRQAQAYCGVTPSPAAPAVEGASSWTWSSWFGAKPSSGDLGPQGPYPASHDKADAPRLEGPPVDDFTKVFRFDMTPDEIGSRWARITTIPGDPPLQGLRVTLVTGTKTTDVAGALTYYYDTSHRVQRITFTGTTGDASRLAEMSTGTFKMKPEPTRAAALLVARDSRKAYSALRVEHAALMRADAPLSRQRVSLELNNPQGGGLSSEFAQWLKQEEPFRKAAADNQARK